MASFPGANGKFVFSTYDTELDQLEVCTENPNATGRSCFAGSANDHSGTWSSSGTRIAIAGPGLGVGEDVFVVNPDGSGRTNLTNNPSSDFEGAWAPGDVLLAFTSYRDGNGEVYSMTQSGTSQTNLTNNAATDGAADWSPHGGRIAFTSNRDGNDEIYVMNPDGSGQQRLTNDPASDSIPSWSPDGSRIAFVSIRDGNPEIYSMAADGTDEVRLTSTPTVREAEPVWSPDGTKIAFLTEPMRRFCVRQQGHLADEPRWQQSRAADRL